MKKSILLNGTILLVAIVLTSFLCMGNDENSKAVSNKNWIEKTGLKN